MTLLTSWTVCISSAVTDRRALQSHRHYLYLVNEAICFEWWVILTTKKYINNIHIFMAQGIIRIILCLAKSQEYVILKFNCMTKGVWFAKNSLLWQVAHLELSPYTFKFDLHPSKPKQVTQLMVLHKWIEAKAKTFFLRWKSQFQTQLKLRGLQKLKSKESQINLKLITNTFDEHFEILGLLRFSFCLS